MRNYNLSHLQQLEAEAIYVLRETAAQFEKPGLLFSGGKDSIIMAYLASKAFAPVLTSAITSCRPSDCNILSKRSRPSISSSTINIRIGPPSNEQLGIWVT